ncbi:MAG: STAS domain-containing protein [Aggregatilineales bacterium]
MAQPPVGIRQNGVLGYIDFPRDVTAQTRENAYAAYNQLAIQRVQAIGFNFSGTDYLNSAGIGLIISLVEDATHAGRKVFAYGLNSHNRKLFRMVGLTERLTLVADEAEMLSKLAPPAPEPPAPQTVAAESATPQSAPTSEPPAPHATVMSEPPAPQAVVAESAAPQASVAPEPPAAHLPTESQAQPELEEPATQVLPPAADPSSPKAEV